MKNLTLLIITTLSFYSCTSFKGFNQGNVPVSSLIQLEGTYNNTPNRVDSIKNYNVAQDRFFYQIIQRKNLRKRFKPLSDKSYTFKLKAVTPNKLLITFFEDRQVIKKFKVKAKIRDDGYVYLQNKSLKITFLVIANGIHHKKTRLFLDPNQRLLVEVASKNIGFIAIAPFGVSHFKCRYIFERTH